MMRAFLTAFEGTAAALALVAVVALILGFAWLGLRRNGRYFVRAAIWIAAIVIAAAWLLGCASVRRECPVAAAQESERGMAVLWCQK